MKINAIEKKVVEVHIDPVEIVQTLKHDWLHLIGRRVSFIDGEKNWCCDSRDYILTGEDNRATEYEVLMYDSFNNVIAHLQREKIP